MTFFCANYIEWIGLITVLGGYLTSPSILGLLASHSPSLSQLETALVRSFRPRNPATVEEFSCEFTVSDSSYCTLYPLDSHTVMSDADMYSNWVMAHVGRFISEHRSVRQPIRRLLSKYARQYRRPSLHLTGILSWPSVRDCKFRMRQVGSLIINSSSIIVIISSSSSSGSGSSSSSISRATSSSSDQVGGFTLSFLDTDKLILDGLVDNCASRLGCFVEFCVSTSDAFFCLFWVFATFKSGVNVHHSFRATRQL